MNGEHWPVAWSIVGIHLEVLVYAQEASWPRVWLIFLEESTAGRKSRETSCQSKYPTGSSGTWLSPAWAWWVLPYPGAPKRQGTSRIRVSSSKEPWPDSETAKIWAWDGVTLAPHVWHTNVRNKVQRLCVPFSLSGSKALPFILVPASTLSGCHPLQFSPSTKRRIHPAQTSPGWSGFQWGFTDCLRQKPKEMKGINT